MRKTYIADWSMNTYITMTVYFYNNQNIRKFILKEPFRIEDSTIERCRINK